MLLYSRGSITDVLDGEALREGLFPPLTSSVRAGG